MKILLFDMDGVLLESHGYHLALQETVRRMAMALGFGDTSLSSDDIAAFEAGGITSEWDEAAISTALLLETAWRDEPGLGLPDSLAQPIQTIPERRLPPDFYELARKLSTPNLIHLHQLERAERFFLKDNRHTSGQFNILHDLILGARMAEISLTHRTFQELVLGSAEFALAYERPALLECESYLLKYDRSNLSSAEGAHLLNWIDSPNHAAAVTTSRPSRPPVGIFSTPEAELGAELVGLKSTPILGWGGMCWLGLKRMTDPQAFLKPSPVHALAAMRMALGDTQEIALIEAFTLVETGQADSSWKQLDGALVSIFEDTPGGFKSLQAAKEQLARVGVRIEANFYGIARNLIKKKALRANGALIYPTLIEALDQAMV
jgi:hypothetical protein